MGQTVLVAGLMNPGEKYRFTRHNAGAMALDVLFPEARYGEQRSLEALAATLDAEERRLLLLKPQTFMNLSGQSVSKAMQKYKIMASHLVVLHDEVELAPGVVRYKFGGGHKGHNGLRNIMERLGGGDFHRIRIGVGRPMDDSRGIADYLLSFQNSAERATRENLLPIWRQALEELEK